MQTFDKMSNRIPDFGRKIESLFWNGQDRDWEDLKPGHQQDCTVWLSNCLGRKDVRGSSRIALVYHDNMPRKRFVYYWPFVKEIYRLPSQSISNVDF